MGWLFFSRDSDEAGAPVREFTQCREVFRIRCSEHQLQLGFFPMDRDLTEVGTPQRNLSGALCHRADLSGFGCPLEMFLEQTGRSIKKVERGNNSYQLIAFDDRETADAVLAHHLYRFQRRS